MPAEASCWFSCLRFCDRRSLAPTPSLATVGTCLPRACVVLIWKLRTSPLSWACPVGTPELEEAPRKPGVHPGMALHGPTVPQAAGSGLCPAGACSGSTMAQLLRLGTVPIVENRSDPSVPAPPELASEVLAVTTSHSPARALPGSSLLLGTVLPRPDPGRISCHSCLTREAIPSSPSTLELPVPPGAPLLGPPGQLSLGEGVATGPKAHRPGMLDLAQNSAGQSSWYQLGMAFLTL